MIPFDSSETPEDFWYNNLRKYQQREPDNNFPQNLIVTSLVKIRHGEIAVLKGELKRGDLLLITYPTSNHAVKNFIGIGIADREYLLDSNVQVYQLDYKKPMTDNFYGNIIDATYSELSITGGLSSDGINLTNAAGDIGLGTLDAVSATVTNGTTAAIFTIPTAKYRSGKIVIQAVAVQETPSAMETTEILYVQGLDTISWIEYATVGIGSEAFVTYEGVINGGNVEFRAKNEYSVPLNFVSSISHLYAIT